MGTSCSETCGGGQQYRSREIVHEASNHGQVCADPLSETAGCNIQACPVGCAPIDCVWGDWGEWSACDKCGGERKRFRHVSTLPECGGMRCRPDSAEEASNCTRTCHQPAYCAFGDWGNWGRCSARC